ncbi:MAG: Rossmann-like domain-containing protein [Desulfomonilia bacterium]
MLEKCRDVFTNAEQERTVQRAVLGLGFIAIELDSHAVGLSANIAVSSIKGCSVFKRAMPIAGSAVGDLMALGREDDLISRSIALAAINALAAERSIGKTGDVFDVVRVSPGETVAMVGLIEPVVRMLEDRACVVEAFDRRDMDAHCIQPTERMPEAFKHADIIIISGTTLINNSLQDLLELPNRAREIIIMGPSTPMVPEIFSTTPITFLAGARVVDAESAFRIIMEGGGTQELHRNKAMEKVIQEV